MGELKMCSTIMFVIGWALGVGTTIGIYLFAKKEVKND